MKNIISRIPLLNRIFDRKTFTFLALDFLYTQTNDSKLIEQFLESVLVTENKNIAITWFDTEDNRNKAYSEIKNLGLLDKFNSQVPANIHYICNNMTQKMEQTVEKNPFFIVSADLT